MSIKEISNIMQTTYKSNTLDPEMMFYEGCEEIARRAGLYWNDDTDIIMLLIDRLPAFNEYIESNKVDIEGL